jgi:hypothetical protein
MGCPAAALRPFINREPCARASFAVLPIGPTVAVAYRRIGRSSPSPLLARANPGDRLTEKNITPHNAAAIELRIFILLIAPPIT